MLRHINCILYRAFSVPQRSIKSSVQMMVTTLVVGNLLHFLCYSNDVMNSTYSDSFSSV